MEIDFYNHRKYVNKILPSKELESAKPPHPMTLQCHSKDNTQFLTHLCILGCTWISPGDRYLLRPHKRSILVRNERWCATCQHHSREVVSHRPDGHSGLPPSVESNRYGERGGGEEGRLRGKGGDKARGGGGVNF